MPDLNLSKGFSGLASGLESIASFKLKQEADEASFLRQKNLDRFRSELSQERELGLLRAKEAIDVRSEERQIERENLQKGTGFANPRTGKEMTGSEFSKSGIKPDELQTVQQFKQNEENRIFRQKVSQLRQLEGEKRELAKDTLKSTIADAFPNTTEMQRKKIFTAVNRKKLVGGSSVPASVKLEAYKQAETRAIDAGFKPESPNFSKQTDKIYNDILTTLGSESKGLLQLKTEATKPRATIENVLLEIGTDANPKQAAQQYLKEKGGQVPAIDSAVKRFLKAPNKGPSKPRATPTKSTPVRDDEFLLAPERVTAGDIGAGLSELPGKVGRGAGGLLETLFK